MSVVQKLKDVLSTAGSDVAHGEQALVAWVRRLIQHHDAGDAIAPPPQVAAQVDPSTLVGGGNTLTPKLSVVPKTPAPAPAPAPAPVQGTTGTHAGTYRNSMTLLADYTVMPDKMKQFADEDPEHWGFAAGRGDPAHAISGWVIVDAVETFKDLIPADVIANGIYKQGFDAAFLVLRGMNEPNPKACFGWVNNTNVASFVDNEATGARCTLADLDEWRRNIDAIYAAQTDPVRKQTVYPQINHDIAKGVVAHK